MVYGGGSQTCKASPRAGFPGPGQEISLARCKEPVEALANLGLRIHGSDVRCWRGQQLEFSPSKNNLALA